MTKAELQKLVDEPPDAAVEGSGVLLLGIISGTIDPDQTWLWTPDLQAAEREADADMGAGRKTRYQSNGESIAALKAHSTTLDAEV